MRGGDGKRKGLGEVEKQTPRILANLAKHYFTMRSIALKQRSCQ